MKMPQNEISLEHAFRRECICPVCGEPESLNVITGRITIHLSKGSPKDSLYTLETLPVFRSHWGSRDAASDREAASLQKLVHECATRRTLVTLIGPCGKPPHEWAFFPNADAAKPLSAVHTHEHYPLKYVDQSAQEKQLGHEALETPENPAAENPIS
jgi:hypothetical protein